MKKFFQPTKVKDKTLDIWTVSLDEINLYGEGKSQSEAIDDLIDSIIELTSLYKKNLITRLNDIEKEYISVLVECNSDRDNIKRVLGV